MTRAANSMIPLVRRASRFQRSVNLKLDIGSVDRLTSFIPTPSLAAATTAFLASVMAGTAQRAHHFYGAYGTGKSTLAVLFAAMVERAAHTLPLLSDIANKFEHRGFTDSAAVIGEYLASGKKFLPVLLSGDEGPIDSALVRGLKRALARVGIPEIQLGSSHQAAVAAIEEWERSFPDTFTKFSQHLAARNRSVPQFIACLEADDNLTLNEFVAVYPELTSGASFDPGYGQNALTVYRATLDKLTALGYSGICVLYDEFGRYLEGLVARVGYRELAYLQEFAEFCSKTTQHPVNLVLFGHKTFGEYANSGRLDDEIQTEWRRIEGRFLSMRISTDPDATYYLVAEALAKEPALWERFEASNRQRFEAIRLSMFDHLMFPGRSSSWIDEFIIRGSYPLHPVAAACLPLLSQEVAQNERTLFTFLTADEPGGLPDLLQRHRQATTTDFPIVTLDQVYDYFAPAIRADLGPGGKHRIWLSANRALNWVGSSGSLSTRLIKAMAALHATGLPAELRPTTGFLAFAVQADFKEAQEALHSLRDAKMLIFRQNAGYWDFFSGSSVDVVSAIDRTIETSRFSPEKLRRLLDQLMRTPGFVAGLHNETYSIRRRFPLEYVTVTELQQVNGYWNEWLDERQVDGVVLGVLADSPHEVHVAMDFAQIVDHPRVLFTIPKEPLRVFKGLRTYAAIITLLDDPKFVEQDPLLADELRFLAQEESDRIEEDLRPLLDPLDSVWYYKGHPVVELRSPRQVNSLVSRICDQVYGGGIPVRYEPVNRRRPSSTITNAVRFVVEELIKDSPLAVSLGLTGKGPEVMVYQSILRDNGFVRQNPDNPEALVVCEPDLGAHPNSHAVWKEIQAFCLEAQRREMRVRSLISKLVHPPYGLRPGVIPVLLAAGMRDYLGVATLRQSLQPVKMILGSTFQDMVENPDQFSLRVETVQPCIRAAMLRLLEEHFGQYVTPADRRGQPVFVYARGLHRWWQGLDRFARETTRLTPSAASFRRLARNAFDQPLQVVYQALPALLVPEHFQSVGELSEEDVYPVLVASLTDLLSELNGLVLDVRRRIRASVCGLFDPESFDEAAALEVWVTGLRIATGVNVHERAFNDVNADGLLRAMRGNADDLIDRLVKSLIGVDVSDWTDVTEEQFNSRIRAAKQTVEQEVTRHPVASSETAATLTLNLPGASVRKIHYTTDKPLSAAAASLLTFLINSFENQSKTLTLEERRRVAADFLKHVVAPE